MNTKLTLTIEEKVIDSAKKYANQKGKSLSSIIENYLRSITSNQTKSEEISPKVLKFMGVIKLPDNFNYKKELGTLISKKYK
ncbi:MAG: DUF6364 family protein [Ferruginibacter sp.]